MEARCDHHRNPGVGGLDEHVHGSFRQGNGRCHNRCCAAALSFATRSEGRFCNTTSDREMTANSSAEFLIWLLIAASIIAVVAKRIGIPYTVALVLGGLLLSVVPLAPLAPLHQGNRPDWLTPDVILTLFLPALLFEGSLKIELRHIKTDLLPLLLLANLGVLVATLVTGLVVYYAVGMSLIVALLFGSMVSATDPISVLSIFKEVRVDERLSVLVEGESLLNDGTAVALFQILLASAVGGGVGLVWGAGQFLLSVVGGALLGLALGYFVSTLTKRIDDAQIEITLTTILAYGTFLLARHLHLSGVIATVAAGLVIGNFATKTGMSARTLTALQSFGLHGCAAQQPVLHTNFFRMATRAGLGWIARSVVAGPGIESRQCVSVS